MKKLFQYLFRNFVFLPFLVSYYSCKEKVQFEDEVVNIAEIEIIDSLTLDYQGNLKIIDYDSVSKRFLAADMSLEANKLVVFNLDGSILSTFDNVLDSKNAFSGLFSGARFDERGVMLETTSGIYIYDENWSLNKFVENTIDGGRMLPSEYKILEFNNYNLSVCKSPNLLWNFKDKEFYDEISIFSIYNENTDQFNNVIKFEEVSTYKTDGLIYPLFSTKFDKNSQNELVVLYPSDPKLYYYEFSGNDFKFKDAQEMNLDYYNIEYSNYNSIDLNMYAASLDSRLQKIISYSDYTYVSYVVGMDHKKFKGMGIEYKPSEKFTNFINENFRHALHIRKSGLKASKDILLPDFLSTPAVSLSDNILLFNIARSRYEFDGEMYFIVKLNL